MRLSLKDLSNKLGVGYELSSYETCPWSVYDGTLGITCSAEVRMNGDGDELEAEIQTMYDTPPEGKLPVEQTFYALFKPATADGWDLKQMKVRGQDPDTSVYNWEEKYCSFFESCVQELKMGNVPDIDELLEREVHGGERFSDSSRGGGSKAPKIKPQKLLGMKQGRGF
jgi:hypothetical protein